MPKKLGRVTAGERVASLAQQFSDDLLLDEQKSFAKLALEFARDIPRLRRQIRSVVGRDLAHPAKALNDADLMTLLSTCHRAALHRSVAVVQTLGAVAIRKGIASIKKELQVCEQTLSPTYQGVADLAAQGATEAGKKILAAAITAYTQDAAPLQGYADSNMRLQFQAAETLLELELRLFSPVPAGLEGFQGRGVWWSTVSDLNASARAVSIRSSNMARESAMATFNAVARGRS
jgi:hypothetical protein